MTPTYNFKLLVKKQVLLNSETFANNTFSGYSSPRDALTIALSRIKDCKYPEDTEIILVPTFKD